MWREAHSPPLVFTDGVWYSELASAEKTSDGIVGRHRLETSIVHREVADNEQRTAQRSGVGRVEAMAALLIRDFNETKGATNMSGSDVAVGGARILIDQARCEGYGFCADAAPELLELDDEGILSVTRDPVDAEDLARSEAAIRVCPVAALKLSN